MAADWNNVVVVSVIPLFVTLVTSTLNICKNQMYYYNWVISSDMFRPLTGHPQANKE